MSLVEEIRPLVVPEVDEAAARRELRAQIARLERQLADALVSAFPRTAIDVGVAGVGGPRLLDLGELEAQRDAMQARLRDARVALDDRGRMEEDNRVLLEQMLLEPHRHKWTRLRLRDLGKDGCGVYQVRPRLGLV